MAMDSALLLALPLVFAIAALAMPAGVGGGMLHVPLLLLLGVAGSANAAAALAQPLIFGATLAAVAYNALWQRRHPTEKLVEPEVALAAILPCLAGTLLGAALNEALPALALHTLLAAVLLLTIRISGNKALSLYREESAAKEPPTAVVGRSTEAAEPVPPPEEEADTPHSSFSALQPPEEGPRQRRRSVEEVAAPAPAEKSRDWRSFAALLLLWAALAAALVLRGLWGLCRWEYWLASGATVLLLTATGCLTRVGTVQPLTCFAVGALSSLVGIGGGVVLNPMLLKGGMEPAKATATVTLMIAMASSNASLNFFLGGAVEVLPALLLAAATFAGSLCGKVLVGWLVARTGRKSLLVFMLTGFMAVSSVCVVAQGVYGAADLLGSCRLAVEEGGEELLRLRNPCA